MKKSYISIVIFGFLLACFAIILQFFEYKYYIGSLSTDIYISVVATFFTAIGIWIGTGLLKKKDNSLEKNKEFNQSKIKELKLNKREYEILQLISQGLSNQEIADKLFLAVPTIKTHISNLYLKLDVRSRTQAISKAQSLNLL